LKDIQLQKIMKIIDKEITVQELRKMAQETFGNMVKAVVDIKRKIMAVDAELHADEEAYLLENGSDQRDLWGINLYPEVSGDDFIEFDSMINLRPAQGNRSRGVEDAKTQEKIRLIVSTLVTR
jgi:Protein of unknown function (DUF5674)